MRTEKLPNTRRIYMLTYLFTALIASIGWMRFQQALRHWYYLIGISLWPHPIYLAITGGLIGIGYSLAAAFHFTANPITPRYVRILGITLIIWLWIDRIFIGMRESFPILFAGTLFLTISLILIDVLVFRKITYPEKRVENGSEN